MKKDKFEQMRCGGCGNDEAKIFRRKGAESRQRFAELYLQCTNSKCNVVTKLALPKPLIEVDYDGGAGDGEFCFGW